MACKSVASWAEPSKRESGLKVVKLRLTSILASLQFLARSIKCHCRPCILHKFANTPSTLQELKLETVSNLPIYAQQWLETKDVGNDKWYVHRMQTCLHEYWHIVGCPNCFCKLTNKLKAFMDPTINFLHVQVASMLAFVFWDSIGKKFGRLPFFLTFPQTIWILDWLGLTNLGQNAKK